MERIEINVVSGEVTAVPLTEDELASVQAAKAAALAEAPRIAILAQIAAIEATVTQRRLREAALTEDGRAWLADVDAQIAALRAQL
jgi:hypothetical protein